MIEQFGEPMLQAGVLGVVCLFFMIKDLRFTTQMTRTLNEVSNTLERISIVIDERIPKK